MHVQVKVKVSSRSQSSTPNQEAWESCRYPQQDTQQREGGRFCSYSKG